MSSKPYVSEQQKWNLKRYFVIYSNNPKMTLQQVAIKLNLDSTTIGKHFKKLFGKEYTSVSKEKSKWNKKISDEQIKIAFEQYKKGKTTKDIAKDFGVRREALVVRMRKFLGKKFQELAKIRRVEDMAKSRQKVSKEKVIWAFEKYKNNRISLAKLSKELKIAESSLTRRFIKLFKEDYRKISRIRRDERKVTKEEYKRVFEKYKTTNTSLAQLSEELGIRVSTLRPVFLRMFGNEYVKVAKKKFDLVEVNRKGQLAEDIAMEFLKLSNIKIDDVR